MLKWDFSFFTNRDSVNIFIYLIDFDPLEIVELCALALKTFNLYWNKHWEMGCLNDWISQYRISQICLNDWISQYRKSQKRQKIRRKLWHDETPGEQTESGNRCRQNKQKVVFLFSCSLLFLLQTKGCRLGLLWFWKQSEGRVVPCFLVILKRKGRFTGKPGTAQFKN